jgi:hypothetical protein
MITIDSAAPIGNLGPHVATDPPEQYVRVSRFRGDWVKRVFRTTPAQRAAIVEIAQALRVTSDGVVRLALRSYAMQRGRDLPGWQPVTSARVLAFDADDDRDRPRAWLRYREVWMPVVEGLYHDKCHTLAGILREAITEFHAAGAGAWRAAMSTPPAAPAAPAAPTALTMRNRPR